jgi:ABC-type multidrug transport system ATPase subunit
MTCDYVVLLQKGKLVMQGTLAEITAAASGGGLSVTVRPEELEAAASVMHRMGYVDAGVIDGAVRTKQTVVDSSLVTRALVEVGIFPSAIEPHHASLEEAFLEITTEDAEVA